MKKILLALFITTVIASCNNRDASPSSSSPTATIDALFTAMKNGNIDDFKKFITKNDAAMLEEAQRLANSIDSDFVKKAREAMTNALKEKAHVTYKLKNEKINGDNATVDAEITDSSKTETHTLELVKEDGAWKISLSKPGNEMFNSMKGNRGAGEPGLKEGMEKFKTMNKDTLKMMMEKGKAFFDTLKARKGNL